MKKNRQLQALLSNYESSLNAEEYESFVREVTRLQNHYFDILNSYRAGAERAQTTQLLIEEQNLQNAHIKTSCQKGCGACCHLEVEITADDADLLARSILTNNIPYDKVRLALQADRPRLDPEWSKGPVTENRCVMLGADNACGNYENRPTICRKHSVTSPAELCSTLGASPAPLIVPMNEIILSAALSLDNNEFGSLPKMLSAAMKRLQPLEEIRALDFEESP
ncbi:MAG: YkgJ family cysteine cluster protein [Bdellovibrionaceae bacterium]|nr:YkgJ family cysteine cluster protein [Pseudobdellovibrionaceae bacterium]